MTVWGRGDKTSKPLDAASNLVFGNIDFDILTFKNLGRIKQFSASGQTSETEISIFGPFEVYFSTYKIFPRRGVFSC